MRERLDHYNATDHPTLLCLSHLRWDFVHQRPQHLLTRAARDYNVLFFEEPVFTSASTPKMTIKRSKEGVSIIVPELPHGTSLDAAIEMQRWLLSAYLADMRRPVDIAWYYTPLAVQFTRGIGCSSVVYDCMDELSGFAGASPRLQACEQELLAMADVVFTGGLSLYEAKRGRHPNVHAFPSSIDAKHFGRARNARVRRASPERLRLGYFGVVDERMDMRLVEEMADMRPDWRIEMVGPVAKINPEALPQRDNLHWLGKVAYDDLPELIATWDVGIMPFALNEATRFISPTKTPEYLSAGCPVVSTAIADVVRPYGHAGLVEIAADGAGFVAAAERIAASPREAWLRAVDKHLDGNSWDATWAAMRARIHKVSRPQAVTRDRVAMAGEHAGA